MSLAVEVNHNGNGDHPVSHAQLLKKKQLACPTLKKCFEEARQQKNNYWIESDLLYHVGKYMFNSTSQHVEDKKFLNLGMKLQLVDI